MESGLISMGERIGLIDEIKTINERVKDIASEAEEVMERLNRTFLKLPKGKRFLTLHKPNCLL